MRDYVIMTDSCCDLTDQMARDLELEVLPLTMHMDGQDYPNDLAGTAISNEEFYKRIRAGKLATTSAVNVGQFQDAMRRVLQSGKDIVCVCFSSALSTTYQSAVIAADDLRSEFPEAEIHVVDSLSASLGQGLLVWMAAKERAAGKTIDEVRDWAVGHKMSICHQFTVDDLHFLKRGGRISSTTAFVGSMLQIKPVLTFADDGQLQSIAKVRGRQQVMRKLVELTVNRCGSHKRYNLAVANGGSPEEMETVRRLLTEALPHGEHLWDGEIDGTLSVYIGDGVLGAAVQVLD